MWVEAGAFPTRGRPIVAIIDTPSEARTRELVARFAEKLRNRQDAISGVEIPGSEAFFRQNALLFADIEQLRAFRQRIENAGPLLSVLIADPNLGGVSTLVERIGRATADLAASRGATVVLAARDGGALNLAASGIRVRGGRAMAPLRRSREPS